MDIGYLTRHRNFVLVDTFGWRILFEAFRIDPEARVLQHLSRVCPLEPRAPVSIHVRLHRRGWRHRGETFLRRTESMWYRGDGWDVFIGPKARSLRVPWRGEFAKVRRPYFALEAPIKDHLPAAAADPGSPSVALLERTAVRGANRAGRVVELFSVERKEFSGFILGKFRTTLKFPTDEDARTFAEGLPPSANPELLDEATALDLIRSKWIKWTPKTLVLVLGVLAFFGFVIAGTIVGFLEGKYQEAGQASVGIGAGAALASWAIPALLRTQRKEFFDLLDKWPRVVCERWGQDYPAQASQTAGLLRSFGVSVDPFTGDLTRVDTYLRSLPPSAFYGTFALQVGLLAISHLADEVGREFESWWEYLPDRRECAFRIEAAGLRLYPLTAVMSVWQMRDAEGLEPFLRSYAREIQYRLAFRETLPAFVALGFTAPGWDAFSKFAPRVQGEMSGRARRRTLRIGDRTYRESALDHGPLNLVLIEEEVGGAEGLRVVPAFAFPFRPGPPRGNAMAEVIGANSEGSVIVRFGEGAPLAIFLDPASRLRIEAAPGGPHELGVWGVVEHGRLYRSRPPEQTGSLPSVVTDGPGQEERSPLAQIAARILEVSQGTNSFTESAMWRLVLELGFANVEVVARNDAWAEAPTAGDLFVGSVWLFARVPM